MARWTDRDLTSVFINCPFTRDFRPLADVVAGDRLYAEGALDGCFFRRFAYHRPKDGMRQATINAAIALNIPLIPARQPKVDYPGNLGVMSVIVNRRPWRSIGTFR